MELKRVVVTGLGALTPLGNTVDEYWNGLKQGKSGAARITRFDPENFKTQFACELKGYKDEDYFDRKEVRKLDPFSKYARIVTDQAVADANLDYDELDRDRVGVIWGSGIGGINTFQEECENFFVNSNRVPRFNPFFIPKMIADIASGVVSMQYGFRGPNFSVVSACASSTHALLDGFNYIRLGKANAMLCGGSEASVIESAIGGFNAMKALSTRNDSPETASRPFDKNRDGFVLGEGAACLVLEEYEHAKARGAHIYCELAGGGLTADAHHLTAPHPEGIGAINVMRQALEDADMSTEDLDYINVHGTSTPLGDKAETIAIKEVFGKHAYDLNISSTKSMTGHLLGAAGAIEALACIKAINDKVVPPTINHETVDPDLDPDLNLTLNKAQKRDVKAALSNTFGFGGHNASVIFREI